MRGWATRRRLFGMRDDIENDVGVIHDDEIKPPISVDPRLPHIVGFIVLFRAQRGMVKIPGEKPDLLINLKTAVALVP